MSDETKNEQKTEVKQKTPKATALSFEQQLFIAVTQAFITQDHVLAVASGQDTSSNHKISAAKSIYSYYDAILNEYKEREAANGR